MLEARHLGKRFHGITVVNDVSFQVVPGEVVGYLGPNGSGKTTTARMLTGLIDTSAGSVVFDGLDISRDLIAFRRRLGYVPEEPHLYPFQSGREYLELVIRFLRSFLALHLELLDEVERTLGGGAGPTFAQVARAAEGSQP